MEGIEEDEWAFVVDREGGEEELLDIYSPKNLARLVSFSTMERYGKYIFNLVIYA